MTRSACLASPIHELVGRACHGRCGAVPRFAVTRPCLLGPSALPAPRPAPPPGALRAAQAGL